MPGGRVRGCSPGCLDLGDVGLPYGAVTEVLRELAGLRRLAGQDAGELQRLVPGLRPTSSAKIGISPVG